MAGRLAHFFGTAKHDSAKIAAAIDWHNTHPEGRRAMEHPMHPPGKHRAAAFHQAHSSAQGMGMDWAWYDRNRSGSA